MISSTIELELPAIADARISEDTLTVDLADSRWELIGRGHGIHWPQLDEDISVANLLSGQRSSESPTSFKRWLNTREIAA